jgi:membrane protein required for colicin V production
MNMAGIDVVFMVIIAISALRCAARGFISELLSMAALIFGVLAALFFFRQGGALIRGWFMPDIKVVPEIIAFIAFFLLVYITAKIIEMTLKSIIEGIQLGGLDHLLGFLFGFVEGLVIVCLLLFLITIQPFFNSDSMLADSFLARILLPIISGDTSEITEAIVLLIRPWGEEEIGV